MIRCERIEFISIRANGYYWSSDETLFHKGKRSTENFISKFLSAQNCTKDMFAAPYKSRPCFAMVWRSRRIELPFFALSAIIGDAPVFQDSIVDTNSFSAPMNFVPLSDKMIDGFSRRAMNL